LDEPALGSGRETFSRRQRLTMPRIVPVHWRVLERVVIATGFCFARQEGSHRSYSKPGVMRPIVIPTYDEVPVAIIRNTLSMAGISRDEYFRLLENV